MSIRDGHFLAGGYFLTRPVERNDQFMSAELLPERILTLSSCLADIALEYWWNEENSAEATKFGVPESRLPELVNWYRSQFDSRLGAPNVAFSVAVIEEFVKKFVPEPDDLVILGCGLDPGSAADLISHYQAPAERGEYGVLELLERKVPLEDGGTLLGFEVVSYEYGLEHSWLCNSLERDAVHQFGITPHDYGLIQTREDAALVADYANRDDVGTEPGRWLPWIVVEYPISDPPQTPGPGA